MMPKVNFFLLYNTLLKKYSNVVFRPILNTATINTDPYSNTILYTLLDKKNYCAYLIAAKSFLQYYNKLRVVVQSDGSLDNPSKKHLREHIAGIEIYERDDTLDFVSKNTDAEVLDSLPDLSRCHLLLPFKLLNVIYRFKGQKVILMDSDLVFLREPTFIIDWIKDGKGYSFYSDGGSLLAETFHKIGFEFPKVDVADFNSGIAGFRIELDAHDIIQIVRSIRAFDEALFLNWEIEQAIWSVLFNRFDNPVNLDDVQNDYVGSGWWSHSRLVETCVLAHFVGAIRFKNLRYVRLANRVMRGLRENLTVLETGEEAVTAKPRSFT
jgi:hypothetical protein